MSTPYGMPPTPPTGVPAASPQKSRAPLFIGLACGCIVMLILLVGAVGVGLYLIGENAEEGPEPTSSSSPTDPGTSTEPSEDPTTGIETDQPVDQPTEGPSTEASSSAGDTFSLTFSAPEEGTTLTTSDEETIESEKGKFLGVDLTLENTGSEDIGLATGNFRFYDEDGEELPIRYAYFQASGLTIPPGDSATGQLFADVSEDAVLKEIGYTDEVGTGGEEVRLPVGG